MSKFIECHNGTWLNTRYITRVVPIRSEKGNITGYELHSNNGILTTEPNYGFNPLELNEIINASPGEYVVEFYTSSTERRPCLTEELIMKETPIIGWRYYKDNWAKPITTKPSSGRGENASNAFFIKHYDGMFSSPSSNRMFNSFDDTRNYALRVIQNQYD